MNTVVRFRGEHFYLSNMYRLETPYITPYGNLPTAEHMYQYAKSKDEKWRKLVVATWNPYTIRKLSRDKDICELRDDWDDVKVDVMVKVLDYKYSDSNPTWMGWLMELDGWTIEEGNYHNDLFWGKCLKTGDGENNLGKLIMARRDVLLLKDK